MCVVAFDYCYVFSKIVVFSKKKHVFFLRFSDETRQKLPQNGVLFKSHKNGSTRVLSDWDPKLY